MRRRVLALLVLVLVLMAMVAFAGLALAQAPPAGRGCQGIKTAIDASERKQGPPQGRPKIPDFANQKAHPAPPFGGCQPPEPNA